MMRDYDLRNPDMVSHGAVGRSIPEVSTADSTLQFCGFLCRRAHPLQQFSKMKFRR